jgi:hypothetical protein
MARLAQVVALISERTKVSLAVKKAGGARLGRPVTMPRDVRKRIEMMKAQGLGWTAIAHRLNGDGVPTAQGRQRSYVSSVPSDVHSPWTRVVDRGLLRLRRSCQTEEHGG